MSPEKINGSSLSSESTGISNISVDVGANLSNHSTSNSNVNNDNEIEPISCENISVTYGPQSDLPPLPVPSLEETMVKFQKHLEALEADGDPEERRATEKIVREFLFDAGTKTDEDGSGTGEASSVTGPALQELLLDYDKTGRKTGLIGSYVEEFWSDVYLAPDSSVVLNLNPYFLLEESPDPKLAGNQIRRAASLCFASVKMASQLRNEKLKPDSFRGKPLCMDQFRALFGASRVPKSRSRDTIATYEKTNHVAVMCRNKLFYFQALWPDNGDVAVDEGDIVNILEAIQTHATKLESESKDHQNEQRYFNSVSALGVLTSLARNQWASAREEMIDYSTKNAESFKVVDSALFVLVLDDFVPKTKQEAAANMLHGSYELAEFKSEGDACAIEYQSGSCTNRWYDKLQIIVTADGGAGINFEHSAIDGHTALRFVSDIYADTVISFAQSITKLVHAHQGLVPSIITATVRRAAAALDNQGRNTLDVGPKKITFYLSEPIKRKIYFAETSLGDQILASDTHIMEFKDYGKQFITFNKLSPDSYVQMSMMLAYYRLYGKFVCAYEPVLTKGFYHGRTEAMRPATMEAKHLCELFCNPSSSTQEKLGALRNATIAHSKLVRECAQGKGVDRHLFALKCIAEKNGLPIPEFFRSESWSKLNHTILSTSNCGNSSLALFGFGPVVPDGYGIGYIIKDSHLHYAICSKHRQTHRYALTLEGVLREMASLLQPISTTEVHDHSSRGSSTNIASTVMAVSNDSHVDIWGESSFQSSIDEGRPGVIHEAQADQRWTGDGIGFTPKSEDFLSPPIKAQLNDIMATAAAVATIATIPEERRKSTSKDHERRGSNDLMPIRPDRRTSGNTLMVGKGDLVELMKFDASGKGDLAELMKKLEDSSKGDLAELVKLDDSSKGDLAELMKIDDSSEEKPKMDDYLEVTKNNGVKSIDLLKSSSPDDNVFLSAPIIAPLNDEVGLGNISPIPGDMGRRGNNDLMPIRPNRRSSCVSNEKLIPQVHLPNS